MEAVTRHEPPARRPVIRPADDARAALAACVDEAREALDGFPVAALMDQYLQSLAAGRPQPADHSAALLGDTVAHWADLLATEIADFPPDTTPALSAQRLSLRRTHDALVALRAGLARFEQQRQAATAASAAPVAASAVAQ